MRPLFAKLEYLQIVYPTFRSSASIVAINKAEQLKKDEEAAAKTKKAAAPLTTSTENKSAPAPSAGGKFDFFFPFLSLLFLNVSKIRNPGRKFLF